MPLQFDTSKPRVQYDIAYACFLLIGLAVLVMGISTLGHEREMYAFVVGIPLMALSGVASVVGVGFSLWLWRHAPLPILSALTAFFIVGLWTETPSADFVNAVAWVYGIILIVIPLWWFLILRRRAEGAIGGDRPRPLYRGAPRAHYDIAYACFLLYGLTALLNAFSALVPIDYFAVLLPLLYLSWAALLVGVGFSIRLWRHALLATLAALTVFYVLSGFFFLGIGELCTDVGVECFEFWFKFMTTVHWAYAIIATGIALWWFVVLRRRADGTMASLK